MRAIRQDGFTLLEMLVVTALAGVLAALAIPSLSRSLNNHQTTGALRSVVGYVRLARTIAVSRNLQSRLVVTGGGSGLAAEVSQGGAWVSAGAPLPLDGGLRVSSVSPPTGLVFAPQGTANAATTITLTPSSGPSRQVAVSLLGSAEVQ